MNLEPVPEPQATDQQEAACSISPHPSAKPLLWYRAYVVLLGIWKYIVGVAFTQNLLPSILVVGWTYRAAQRAVQKHWWRLSNIDKSTCFCDFTQASSFHRGLGGWPNWVVENNREWMRAHHTPGLAGKIKRYWRTLLYSLWLNLKIGLQGVFNTSVFVGPGCALMLFSWYAGWHNSFNKGYEQAIVGPLTGLAGVFLFIAAMYYVPMAQLRQASTGNWKAFYQFRIVWQIIRKRWLACLGLAMLFSAVSVPFTIIKTAPTFFSHAPELAALTPDKAYEFAKAYYFFTAFILFGGYLILRLAAARVYAGAVVDCLRSGALSEDSLAENEWETLHRLDLIGIRPPPQRHIFVKTIAWCGTKLGRATVGVALFFTWFSFISQVYISEFMLKTEYGRGWLNQPLVQLPWFNYIPSALEAEGTLVKAKAAQPANQPPPSNTENDRATGSDGPARTQP